MLATLYYLIVFSVYSATIEYTNYHEQRIHLHEEKYRQRNI